MAYNILVFDTEPAAQTCLTAVYAAIISLLESQGRTVQNNKVVSKDAAGNDDLTAPLSDAWDDITPSPESTPRYYFSSPNNVANYSGIMAEVGAAFTGEEIPLPDGWIQPYTG